MIKTLVLLLACVSFAKATRCWNCQSAANVSECIQKGHLQTCRRQLDVCHTQMRRQNGITLIFKSCKDEYACVSKRLENRQYDGRAMRCNSHSSSSVCDCCCRTDSCNAGRRSCNPTARRRTTTQRTTTMGSLEEEAEALP